MMQSLLTLKLTHIWTADSKSFVAAEIIGLIVVIMNALAESTETKFIARVVSH